MMTVAKVYVLMGVSGSGKSTVGSLLAEKLAAPFYDGDDFHPPENVAKMAGGTPLTDKDRRPWLARLNALIAQQLAKAETAVVACSALKRTYRDQLRQENEGVQFIYLKGEFDLIHARMRARDDHFMKAEMLRSQFETLEEPDAVDAVTIPINTPVADIISTILQGTD